MLLDLLAIYMCCLWNKVWSKCTKNILLVPRIHERKTCMSVFFLIDIYTRKKKMKEGKNRPRFSQLLLNADEPEGEQISLNFTIYFLLCTTLSSLLVQLKRTSSLVGCTTSILTCVWQRSLGKQRSFRIMP